MAEFHSRDLDAIHGLVVVLRLESRGLFLALLDH